MPDIRHSLIYPNEFAENPVAGTFPTNNNDLLLSCMKTFNLFSYMKTVITMYDDHC